MLVASGMVSMLVLFISMLVCNKMTVAVLWQSAWHKLIWLFFLTGMSIPVSDICA